MNTNITTLCFGKLPQFGDFIRYNAAGAELKLLDDWLQTGMAGIRQRLDASWETQYRQAPAYHFLYAPGGGTGFLVGVLMFSRDKSERKYPFLISLQMSRQHFDTRYKQLIPIVFGNFLNQADALLPRIQEVSGSSEIIHMMQNLSPAIDYREALRQYQYYVNRTTVEAFFRQSLGSFSDPRKYLLFKNLLDGLLPLRSRDLSRVTLGFRFPLGIAPGKERFSQVCFWLDVAMQVLRHPAGIFPTLFWSHGRDEAPEYLFLFFSPPPSGALASLISVDLDADAIFKLEADRLNRMAAARQELPEPYASLLDSSAISLNAFLQRLW